MKKKENRVRVPEGIKELSASDYRKYANINSDAVEKYPETIKAINKKVETIESNSYWYHTEDKQTIVLGINNIIEYINISKKKTKRCYLTSNIFYGGVHFAVRKKIVDGCRKYLNTLLRPEEIIKNLKTPIAIEYIYISQKNTTFDLDNKLSFWNKIFSDWLVENNIIPDDNVNYIRKISYEYQRGYSELRIKIRND
jgi:hypothetical protein